MRVGLHYGSGKAELGTMRALLLNLSDGILKEAQNNTVVVQQKEVDRVGFEPTASAMPTKNVDHCQMIISRSQVQIPSSERWIQMCINLVQESMCLKI